jgi:DNA-binding LacI/PurR family transcriptional regulator
MSDRKKKVTIKDVAIHAGVSVTTVSNYLNQNFLNMSVDTRSVVENSIKQLSYYPSIGARALSRRRMTKTVGIVIPHSIDYTFHHPYFAEVMRGLSSVLENNGYRAMLLARDDRSESDLNYLKSLSNGIVDGFVFFDIARKDEYINSFLAMEVPLMVVGKNPEGEMNYVDTDVVRGAVIGTDYLLSKNVKKIILITGPDYMVFSEQTIAGFEQSVRRMTEKAPAAEIVPGPFLSDFGLQEGRRIFAGKEYPIAIYSASGQTTLGLMKAAEEFDKREAQDFFMISFGEHPMVRLAYPAMPFIKQPEQQIGQLIGYRLMDLILNVGHVCEPIILPLEFVIPETAN